jgi:hypothetical protein
MATQARNSFKLILLLSSFLFLMFPSWLAAQFSDEVVLAPTNTSTAIRYGISVSIDGDSALVGAYGGLSSSGRAYIYVRNPATDAWGLQRVFTPPTGGDSLGWFGYSVALSGDTALIGWGRDDALADNSGSAVVFVRDSASGTWSEQQKLTASDGAASDFFGNDVAVHGDFAVIGATGNSASFGKSGAAYVYERDPATGVWTQVQKLAPTEVTANFAGFGTAVAIEGDRMVVGSSAEDVAVTDSGAAYIYKRDSGTGVWNLEQKIRASDPEFADAFGVSVSLSGDTVLIGAFQDNDDGTDSGSAYVFVRDAGSGQWIEQQKLTASDASLFYKFGQSTTLLGDVAVVGSAFAEAAYVFERDPGTQIWTETQKITASITTGDFGESLAISGDRLIVGASLTNRSVGSAFIYSAPLVSYVVSATVAAGNGTVSCDPASVTAGGSSTCTAVSDTGWQVSGWTGDCAAAGTSETCTLDNIQADQSSTVSFETIPVTTYNVTATVATGNGGASCNPASVTAGGSSTCTAVPDTGWQVSGWTGDCAAAGTSETCTLDNIQSDQSSTVSFEEIPLNIVATVAAGNGTVSCDPASVTAGGSSTCTAVPDTGWQVSGWTGDCAAAGTSETCTLDNVQSDQTSGVNFEVASAVPVEVTPVPMFSRLGLIILSLLIVLTVAIRFRW